jgi:MFS-type transporter involved in bile tolerance (Atg22 family)
VLTAIGGPHLDEEVPMRMPWVVVINVLPVVVTLMLLAVPNELRGRLLGFVASSLVAAGASVVGLAAMVRIAVPRERGAHGGRVADDRGHTGGSSASGRAAKGDDAGDALIPRRPARAPPGPAHIHEPDASTP